MLNIILYIFAFFNNVNNAAWKIAYKEAVTKQTHCMASTKENAKKISNKVFFITHSLCGNQWLVVQIKWN